MRGLVLAVNQSHRQLFNFQQKLPQLQLTEALIR